MRFRLERAAFFCRLLLAPVVMLSGVVSAEAQCNVQQIYKLLADDGAEDDFFGSTVAISGNTAIVGTFLDDDNGDRSGSAYLFDITTGQQIHKLLPDDGAEDDFFGGSVAISGRIAIVGAGGDDNNGNSSGSAYLFDVATGQQFDKLVPEDGDHGFGSVAISGKIAIVGAQFGVDNGSTTGAAYLFDTTTGQQIARLLADDGDGGDRFGVSVAISGNTAIVGAYRDDDNGDLSGSAYLFNTTTGQQTAKLLAEDGETTDRFGQSVSISGNTAIVGVRWDDDNGDDSGSAYLFDSITGGQIAKLLPDDGAPYDRFGWSTSISGNIAIVGSRQDDNQNGFGAGAAYLFDTTTGKQITKFLADDGDDFDYFGHHVSINGNSVIVGAERDDNNNGDGAGSAYLFDVSCAGIVVPDSFLLTRGTYVSGGVADLAESDNVDLSIQRATADTQSRTEFELKAVSPVASPASLEVTLEGAVFARSQVNQTIELFDYVAGPAGQWEQIDARAATRFTDSTVTATATGDLSRFVEAGTMCMKARIRYQSPVARQRFSSNTDQFIWSIGQ